MIVLEVNTMKKYLDIIIKWIKTADSFILDLLYPEVNDDTSNNDISKSI